MMQLTAYPYQSSRSFVPRETAGKIQGTHKARFGNETRPVLPLEEDAPVPSTTSATDMKPLMARMTAAKKAAHAEINKKTLWKDFKDGLVCTLLTSPFHVWIPGSQLLIPFLWMASARAWRATIGLIKGLTQPLEKPVTKTPKNKESSPAAAKDADTTVSPEKTASLATANKTHTKKEKAEKKVRFAEPVESEADRGSL
jgi:hypothetical protein